MKHSNGLIILVEVGDVCTLNMAVRVKSHRIVLRELLV